MHSYQGRQPRMPPAPGLFLPLLCLCTCLHTVSAQSVVSKAVPNFGMGLAYGYNMQLTPNTNIKDFQNAAPAKWWGLACPSFSGREACNVSFKFCCTALGRAAASFCQQSYWCQCRTYDWSPYPVTTQIVVCLTPRTRMHIDFFAPLLLAMLRYDCG